MHYLACILHVYYRDIRSCAKKRSRTPYIQLRGYCAQKQGLYPLSFIVKKLHKEIHPRWCTPSCSFSFCTLEKSILSFYLSVKVFMFLLICDFICRTIYYFICTCSYVIVCRISTIPGTISIVKANVGAICIA